MNSGGGVDCKIDRKHTHWGLKQALQRGANSPRQQKFDYTNIQKYQEFAEGKKEPAGG